MKLSILFKRIDLLLLVTAGVLFLWHISVQSDLLRLFKSENLYTFSLQIDAEGEEEFEFRSFLPIETRYQNIHHEGLQNPGLEYEENFEDSGRRVQWQGAEGAFSMRYDAQLVIQPVSYQIDESLVIPYLYEENLAEYLAQTEAVPVDHPEIKALWQEIRPENDARMLDVLNSIYSYTKDRIDTVPFKGMTDSLTALRLGMASCNGKSRLFVSLARLNNIPARLVGGVVLSGGRKKTSHQWVEVYIQGNWVPFDPTNGHFASYPGNYLALYWGDHSLFSRSTGIRFDYQFNAGKQTLSKALYTDVEYSHLFKMNLYELLASLNLPVKMASLFLLFPLAALIITFFRNVLGLKTFGVFMPMLVASACTFTGLLEGLTTLLVVLAVAYAGYWVLDHYRLLKIPKLSAIITVITIVFLVGLYLSDVDTRRELSMLTFFPVIIISFMAEKLQQLSAEKKWIEIAQSMVGSLVTVLVCFMIFESTLMQGVFILFPELLLVVLALQLYIGSWTGIRVSEMLRFNGIGRGGDVMGINRRNRDFVNRYNTRAQLLVAADKLQTKEYLEEADIPTAETLFAYAGFNDLRSLSEDLEGRSEFVIKPNNGSQGSGILVIRENIDGKFVTAGGRVLSLDDIRHHIQLIINGNYSQTGEPDTAFIEPFIHQHPVLNDISNSGLSDIRVIVKEGKLISAMLRIPTAMSDGKANLHQGAIGVAVDIETGITHRAVHCKKNIEHHPDTAQPLIGVQLPFWKAIREYSMKCQSAVGLGYAGVDIALDVDEGPLVLEVNGRPGIEIQNVQGQGLQNALA